VKLVRVVAPHFVAAFETDGIVRRTAPILKRMLGWTDDRARKYIASKGWRASIVPEQIAFSFEDASLILDTTKPNKYDSPD
jgi:hypothetical protein